MGGLPDWFGEVGKFVAYGGPAGYLGSKLTGIDPIDIAKNTLFPKEFKPADMPKPPPPPPDLADAALTKRAQMAALKALAGGSGSAGTFITRSSL